MLKKHQTPKTTKTRKPTQEKVNSLAHLIHWLQIISVVNQVAESHRITTLCALCLERVLLDFVTEGMNTHTSCSATINPVLAAFQGKVTAKVMAPLEWLSLVIVGQVPAKQEKNIWGMLWNVCALQLWWKTRKRRTWSWICNTPAKPSFFVQSGYII